MTASLTLEVKVVRFKEDAKHLHLHDTSCQRHGSADNKTAGNAQHEGATIVKSPRLLFRLHPLYLFFIKRSISSGAEGIFSESLRKVLSGIMA